MVESEHLLYLERASQSQCYVVCPDVVKIEKGIVSQFGEYPCELSGREFDKKIDITVTPLP